MLIGYICDEALRIELNKNNQNYWDVYIREINEQLGLCAVPLSLKELENDNDLKKITALFIGCQSGQRLTDIIKKNLRIWVQNGGLLIGFAVQGLDDIFGIETQAIVEQTGNNYTISGYFDFKSHKLTEGIHSFLEPDQKLLIFSDIQIIKRKGTEEIAHLYTNTGKETENPAITWQCFGKGYTACFAFDVAKTFWIIQQGRPIYEDPDNIWLRTPDKNVIEDNHSHVAYTDEILFLLQNIIVQIKHPFIYQIPPTDNNIPVALFHWAGDDEGDNTGIQLKASDWMKQKGLPYHINVMEVADKEIPLTKEDAAKIIKNGHEIACHYNFTISDGIQLKRDGNNLLKATEFEVKRQSELFESKFGLKSLVSAIHCCIWYGDCEPAKWMKKAGGIANNNYCSPGSVFNGSNLNFGFGTSYPYHFYDDSENKNDRIDFLEIPITGYELGHRASSGGDKMEVVLPEVFKAVEVASYYHLVFNMFYHPVYIYDESGARKAVEGFLNYIKEKGITVLHMGTNAVAEWWNERAKSKIYDVSCGKNVFSFNAYCSYKAGMIIKLPVEGSKFNLMIDDQDSVFEEKNEFGNTWLYFICPCGDHKVQVLTEGSIE